MNDEQRMRRAIELSRHAIDSGEGTPFGAVVVRDGVAIGEGWNQSRSLCDPTAHAEMIAIRNACRLENTLSLAGCDIFASGHPCPMCMAALHWVGVDRLIFGSSTAETATAAPMLSDAHVRAALLGEPSGRAIPSMQLLRDEAVAVIEAYGKGISS